MILSIKLKYLIVIILVALHSAKIFYCAVIMSEINPLDCKIIKACHFPDEALVSIMHFMKWLSMAWHERDKSKLRPNS